MCSKNTICAIIMLLSASTCSLGDAAHEVTTGTVLPKVDIGGLDGAAHWLHFEAEDASKYHTQWSPPFAPNHYPGNSNSGRDDSGVGANTLYFNGFQVDWIEWGGLHIPAAMNAPTLLVNYIAEFAERHWSVHLGESFHNDNPALGEDINKIGAVLLDFNGDGIVGNGGTPGSGTSTLWADGQLSAIGAGDQQFRLHLRQGNQGGRFDNFLLYDGNIDRNGHGSTAELFAGYNQWWKQPNHAGDYQELSAPVTPTITVSGAQSYTITLDGQPYISGTPIAAGGNHRLTVIANGYDDGSRIARRIMAGADFSLPGSSLPPSPVPRIDIEGLDGAAHWLHFEAEDASEFFFSFGGGPSYSHQSQTSGWTSGGPANCLRYDGFQNSWIKWDNLHVPADMDAPKLLVNYICDVRDQTWSVHTGPFVGLPYPVGSNTIGQFTLLLAGGSGSGTPSKWTDARLIGIPAGDQDFGIHMRTENGNIGNFDNFLLYDGDIDASGHGQTAAAGPMWWKQDNHAGDYKVIGLGDVAPAITVTGAASVEYRLRKDGVSVAYNPGDTISGEGCYRLTVIANGTGDGAGHVGKRIMAGADFTIGTEPEPDPVCGDASHPYPSGDLTRDCNVNLDDLEVFMANWLDCTNPNPPCNYSPGLPADPDPNPDANPDFDPDHPFPIGWYVGPNHAYWLSEIKADSDAFNCTNPYGSTNIVAYINESTNLNMGIFQFIYAGPIRPFADPSLPGNLGTLAALTDYINTYKMHPAIWYWSLADEPEILDNQPGVLQAFEDSYHTIKAADPDRLVTAVFCDPEKTAVYMPFVDFPMFDAYPVNTYDSEPCIDMFKVTRDTKIIAAQAAAAGKGPPVFVCQAHIWLEGDLRFPTEYETRYMSFAPITVGARGVLNFSYNLDAAWKMGPEQRLLTGNIADQINSMVPVIESAQGDGGVTVTSNCDSDTSVPAHGVNDITYLFRQLGADYYLIAVNNTFVFPPTPKHVAFTLSGLPAGSYSAEVVGEGRSLDLDANILTDMFANYEVHIYRISPGSGPTYLRGDLNEDLSVNLADFVEFTSYWMDCTDPGPPCNYMP